MAGIDSYTKLLLHCDGADASTTFIDSATGKTVTAAGNAQIDTAQSKFGGASALFDGTGDYLSLADSNDWNFGTGNFTIDFWVRMPSLSSNLGLFSQVADSTHWYSLYYDATAGLIFRNDVVTINIEMIQGGVAGWATNIWYHVAVVRNGNAFNIYRGGISIASTTDTDAMGDIAGVFKVGMEYAAYFNGWIDEFRVSKGIARWTANFTPPTSPYSRTGGSFLLNFI